LEEVRRAGKTLPTANCLQSAMDNTRKKGNVRNDVAE
jgi:hypothetical protein